MPKHPHGLSRRHELTLSADNVGSHYSRTDTVGRQCPVCHGNLQAQNFLQKSSAMLFRLLANNVGSCVMGTDNVAGFSK